MANRALPTSTTEAQASTPVDAAPSQAAQASEVVEQTQSPVLDPALLEAFGKVIDSRLQNGLDQWSRQQQSARDKWQAQVNKQLQSFEKAFSAANEGKPPTDQQRAALRQQAEQEASGMQSREVSPDAPEEPTRPTQPEDAISAAAWQIMDDEGIDIEPGDPEAKLIDWSSPAKARRTTLAAIDAKRARKATGSNAVVGGMPGTTRSALEKELAELIAKPDPRKIKRMKELEQQLRR